MTFQGNRGRNLPILYQLSRFTPLLGLSIGFGVRAGQAATITWLGVTGNWQESTNWLPVQAPTTADTAIVGAGFVTNTDTAVFGTTILTNDGDVSGPLGVAAGAVLVFGP